MMKDGKEGMTKRGDKVVKEKSDRIKMFLFVCEEEERKEERKRRKKKSWTDVTPRW